MPGIIICRPECREKICELTTVENLHVVLHEYDFLSKSPEVVKREMAGEKHDVLAVGCILYQMATLNPPFYSTNMLSLATKSGLYKNLCQKDCTLKKCRLPLREAHPDIVEVSSLLSDVMMKYLDVLPTSHLMLEKKLDWKRRRTQQYFMEADRNAVTYHHQFSILSQKNCEKLSLHSSSNGAASCKSEFSENTDLPVDSCQSACGKYEEGTYEEILVEDHRTIEKAYESENTTSLPCTVSGETDSGVKYHALVNTLINWQISKSNVLLQGSAELIEPNILTADWHMVLLSSGGNMLLPDDRKGMVGTSHMTEGMTYEQLQTLIEEVLEESDYYSFSSNRSLYYPKGTMNCPAEEENM